MSLKKQIINYFEFNKELGADFIFFDKLPSSRVVTSKSKRIIDNNAPSNLVSEKSNVEKIEIQKSENIISQVAQPTPGSVTQLKVAPVSKKKPTQDLSSLALPDLSVYNTLEKLEEFTVRCQNCVLGTTRTKLVFGEGHSNADIMVIGEAPGEDEDLQGKPFVGRAGKLLTDILKAVDFSREEVYIANICKCRPPANRKPTDIEVYHCEPYLKKQIELIKPQFILALGLTAAEALFKRTFKMGDIRGQLFDYHGIKTLVTYHPAALLRNPNWKKPVWEDVKLLRQLYDEYLKNNE